MNWYELQNQLKQEDLPRLQDTLRGSSNRIAGGADPLLSVIRDAEQELEEWRPSSGDLPPALERLTDHNLVLERWQGRTAGGVIYLMPIIVAWGYLLVLIKAFEKSQSSDLLVFWRDTFPFGMEGLPIALLVAMIVALIVDKGQDRAFGRSEERIARASSAVASSCKQLARLGQREGGVDGATKSLREAATELARAASALREVNSQSEGFKDVAAAMAKVALQVTEAGNDLTRTLSQFSSASATAQEAVLQWNEGLDRVAELAAGLSDRLRGVEDSLAEVGASSRGLGEQAESLSRTTQSTNELLSEVRFASSKLESLAESLDVAVKESQTVMRNLTPASVALTKASGRLEHVLELLDDPLASEFIEAR